MKLLRLVFILFVGLMPFVYPAEKQTEIKADRRMLVRVRNSTLTITDVMRKMDLIFYQQFPHLRSMPKERLKFYETNWRRVLQDLVDRKLIMIFAEENHFEVPHGDVREEMEAIFGPNVLLALYDAKVPFEDAYDMVRQEIMMRRIVSFYVKGAVLASLTPQKVKERYREKYEQTLPQEKIVWHILSLKTPAEIDSKALMEKIVSSLNEGASTFEKEKETVPENCELILSPLFVTESAQVSPAIKPILDGLETNRWSAPLPAKEMKNGVAKWNAYLVKERKEGEKIPFSNVEDAIREEMAGPLLEEKRVAFMNDLAQKYDLLFAMSEKEMDAYHPFSLP